MFFVTKLYKKNMSKLYLRKIYDRMGKISFCILLAKYIFSVFINYIKAEVKTNVLVFVSQTKSLNIQIQKEV